MGILGWKRKPVELSAADRDYLNERLSIIRFLSPAQRNHLFGLTARFLKTKQFVQKQPTSEDRKVRLDVAAMACLPVLELGLECYRGWRSIILVPEAGLVRQEIHDDGPVVHEHFDEIAGEVLPLGPVVLALPDVAQAGRGTGYNVVVHEMAHKLDDLDGELNGCPALSREAAERWVPAFAAAFADLQAHLKTGRGRRAMKSGRLTQLPLDDYAAESPAEFFAVCCEEFFERPLHLRRYYPIVFQEMIAYFGLDPST